jgi:DNA-binding PadR family transcriptional regulator
MCVSLHIRVPGMALEHVILVALEERPGTGYELRYRFGRSFGFFWDATHQQIYKVLGRMVDAGWVTYADVAQQGKPDKKVYRVSEAGRAELARWLAEPVDRPADRDALAVKVRGASYGELPVVVAEVARHRALHAERLDVYQAVEKRDFPDPGALSGRALHQYLVLRGGIRHEQSRIDWCDEVLDALRRDAPAGGTPSSDDERHGR